MGWRRDIAKQEARRGGDPLQAGLEAGMNRSEAYYTAEEVRKEVDDERTAQTRALLGLDRPGADRGTPSEAPAGAIAILIGLAVLPFLLDFALAVFVGALLVAVLGLAFRRSDQIGHLAVLVGVSVSLLGLLAGLEGLGVATPAMSFLFDRTAFSTGWRVTDVLALGAVLSTPLIALPRLCLRLTDLFTRLPLAGLVLLSRVFGRRRRALRLVVVCAMAGGTALWLGVWTAAPAKAWVHFLHMGVVPALSAWATLLAVQMAGRHEDVLFLARAYRSRRRSFSPDARAGPAVGLDRAGRAGKARRAAVVPVVVGRPAMLRAEQLDPAPPERIDVAQPPAAGAERLRAVAEETVVHDPRQRLRRPDQRRRKPDRGAVGGRAQATRQAPAPGAAAVPKPPPGRPRRGRSGRRRHGFVPAPGALRGVRFGGLPAVPLPEGLRHHRRPLAAPPVGCPARRLPRPSALWIIPAGDGQWTPKAQGRDSPANFPPRPYIPPSGGRSGSGGMDEHTLQRLMHLVLLGAAILGYLLVANRDRLGTLLRQGMLWGLIFVGVIAAAGLWEDIRQAARPRQAVIAAEGRIEVPRAPDGHYYLTLEIGGVPVRFVVDTGATDIVLSRADARRVGIDLDRLAFTGTARTANGLVRTARVRLDEVALGPFRDRRVAAWVNEGELDTSLLGMAYLQRFERIEIARDRLILTR